MWTDELCTRLRLLWAEGRSARQAAFVLRMGRGAVCGKIHRLGLKRTAPRIVDDDSEPVAIQPYRPGVDPRPQWLQRSVGNAPHAPSI